MSEERRRQVLNRLEELTQQDVKLRKLDKVLLRGVFTSNKTGLLNPKIGVHSDDEGITPDEDESPRNESS